MTVRTLLRHNIAQLEEIFATSESDTDTLTILATELQYRHVPRAAALLQRVQTKLKASGSATSAGLTPPRQSKLFEAPSSVLPKSATLPAKEQPKELPTLSAEEAYRVLRVSVGAAWEDVEAARRRIVQRAHPEAVVGLSAEKRAGLQLEAKRANAAYAALLRIRNL